MKPDSFSEVCSDRTRSNGQKTEHRKLHTNMWKSFFPVSVTEPGTGYPERYRDTQDLSRCLLAYGSVPTLAGELDSISRGPFQTLQFCDSVMKK